jgi:hypothetical protein
MLLDYSKGPGLAIQESVAKSQEAERKAEAEEEGAENGG